MISIVLYVMLTMFGVFVGMPNEAITCMFMSIASIETLIETYMFIKHFSRK